MQRAEPPAQHDPVAGFEHAQPQRVVTGRDREQRAVRAPDRNAHERVGVEAAGLRIVDEHARERVTGASPRDRRRSAPSAPRPFERALGLRGAEQREREDRDHDAHAPVDEPRACQRRDADDEHARVAGPGPARSPARMPSTSPAERRAARRARSRQTVTRSRSCARRPSPMPGTRLRSSTLRNGPLRSRSCTIAPASVGPMPGSVSSCSQRSRC